MKLKATSSPHIRSKRTTRNLMSDVIIALLPALSVGVFRFGFRALVVTLVSVLGAAAGEWLCGKLFYHRNTMKDLSFAVTGMLLAMSLPATVPYWLAAVGSLFAIVVVKGLGGGLGKNIFNPALAARAFLMLLWPVHLVRYAKPGTVGRGADLVTSATPLHHMRMPALPEESLGDLFFGNAGGCIGEVCTLALLAGGMYLLWKGVISLGIPLAYLGTVAVLSLMFAKTDQPVLWMLYSLLSGGVVLGALFMATDYATAPVTFKGRIIYGIGCGLLTVFFRNVGLYPEGVTYAILLMNAGAWGLDTYTAPRRFGEKKGKTA